MTTTRRPKLTRGQKSYITKVYEAFTDAQLALRLKISPGQVQQYRQKRKLFKHALLRSKHYADK